MQYPSRYLSRCQTRIYSVSGLHQNCCAQVRSICSETELDALQTYLPVEAYEGLFLVAAGDSVSQVLGARETRVDRPVNTEDFAAAIETRGVSIPFRGRGR